MVGSIDHNPHIHNKQTYFLCHQLKTKYMSHTIKGTIYKIGQIEIKSDKLSVREFVVKHGTEQYPEFIPFQLKNDKCALINLANEGDEIEVNFNIRGREWNGKFFVNLEAWKLSINQGI